MCLTLVCAFSLHGKLDPSVLQLFYLFSRQTLFHRLLWATLRTQSEFPSQMHHALMGLLL